MVNTKYSKKRSIYKPTGSKRVSRKHIYKMKGGFLENLFGGEPPIEKKDTPYLLEEPTNDEMVESPTVENENEMVESPTVENENEMVESPTVENENEMVESPTVENENEMVESPTVENENEDEMVESPIDEMTNSIDNSIDDENKMVEEEEEKGLVDNVVDSATNFFASDETQSVPMNQDELSLSGTNMQVVRETLSNIKNSINIIDIALGLSTYEKMNGGGKKNKGTRKKR